MRRDEDEVTARTPKAQRALNMGIFTWLGNAGGCLLGMIPLALPLTILATGITLITGIMAMMWGVSGRRAARQAGDESGERDARIGFWLGVTHLVIVLLVGAAVGAAAHFDLFGGGRLLRD